MSTSTIKFCSAAVLISDAFGHSTTELYVCGVNKLIKDHQMGANIMGANICRAPEVQSDPNTPTTTTTTIKDQTTHALIQL